MRDLAQIEAMNDEAYGREIRSLNRKGVHVVALYTGLTIYSIQTFIVRSDAEFAVHAPVSSPDQRRVLFVGKYEEPVTFTRDQSEDRAAALVAQTAQHLGLPADAYSHVAANR